MYTVTIPLSIAALVNILIVAIAFFSAPRSCDGGLELYVWSGAAALMLLAALPFVTSVGNANAVRLAWGLGFVVFGALVWIGGLLVANVRLLCRLF